MLDKQYHGGCSAVGVVSEKHGVMIKIGLITSK